MKKNYIIAGAIALLIFAFAGGALYLKKYGNNLAVFGKKQIFLKASFAKVEDNAFNLANIQPGSQAGLGGNSATAENDAVALSAKSGVNAPKIASDTAKISGAPGAGSGGIASGTSVSRDKIAVMPCFDGADGCVIPEITRYEYVYKGEKPDFSESRLPVFKRVKGFGKDINASDILGNFSADGINLNKFSSARADSLSLTEDREYGYSLNVNFTEGNFSLNQNWNTWPHPEQKCRDEACYQSFRLKESDMLSDAEAISIAGQFLSDYGISVDGYGPGEMLDDWRGWYANAENKTDYYFPDTISVLYPLIINGQPVFEEGGGKVGINVSISVREKKVSGVWNLNSQNYQSSLYDIETDWNKILEMAKNGSSGYYPYPLAAKSAMEDAPETQGFSEGSRPKSREIVKEIELDTPILGLVRMWIYENNLSDELLVPAVIFPVKKGDKNIWQNYVIVPLVKEIIEKRNGGYEGGPIRIMDGVTEYSAEPSSATPIPPSDQPVKFKDTTSGVFQSQTVPVPVK